MYWIINKVVTKTNVGKILRRELRDQDVAKQAQ